MAFSIVRLFEVSHTLLFSKGNFLCDAVATACGCESRRGEWRRPHASCRARESRASEVRERRGCRIFQCARCCVKSSGIFLGSPTLAVWEAADTPNAAPRATPFIILYVPHNRALLPS
jgi:hypothetical protein